MYKSTSRQKKNIFYTKLREPQWLGDKPKTISFDFSLVYKKNIFFNLKLISLTPARFSKPSQTALL